jgi:hypothetical protein
MKRIAWAFLLFVAAAPLWAAKKITVQELKDTLISLHQAYKSDDDIAAKLKEVELSEELNSATRASLSQYISGPLAAAQLDILEGQSSILAPPSSELPATPPPDATTQKAILAKALDYATKTYPQNPHFTVSKVTSRYQDEMQNPSSAPGLNVSAPNGYALLWEKRVELVDTDRGIEKPAASKGKTQWGQNGQISEGESGPNLSALLQEASAVGKLDWLRWQTVNGKRVAVFSFAVDKKKSHFDVNYCCFASTETQAEIGTQAGAVQPVVGNIQSLTSWKQFKKVVPYHGELFIDPDAGTVQRVITYADLKPTDFVHQEAMRIDYDEVVVDGKPYILPVDSFTINEVVPNGDSNQAAYSVRHTLFIVDYQNYRQPGSTK